MRLKMNNKDYLITIKSGHHIVDMNPKLTPFEIALGDFSTSVETAAKAFREYFESIPKIR